MCLPVRASEQAVHELYSQHPEIWESHWRAYCIRKIAEAVRGCLASLSPLNVDCQIGTFAGIEQRRTSVHEPTAVTIIAAIMASPGEFRNAIIAECTRRNIGPPSRTRVESIIIPLITRSIASSQGNSILEAITSHEIYVSLADILSEELYAIVGAGQYLDEQVVLIRSLLAYYLRRWRFPLTHFTRAINPLNASPSGIRGSLISIHNHHRPTNNSDDFNVPISAFVAANIPPAIQAESDLLVAIQNESRHILSGTGFFHRAMSPTNPVDPQLLEQNPNYSEAFVQRARLIAYPQYEHTALIFMSIASIEFLLRTYCPTVTGADAPIDRVISLHTQLSQDLRNSLNGIYRVDEWNIRNRCVHGSFLEIEARRVDLILNSGLCASMGAPTVDLSNDGSLPSNVSAVVLNCLCDLSQSLQQAGITCNTAWTQHFHLTEDELEFANSVSCDILENYNTAMAWYRDIQAYLRDHTPCLSIPIQEGLRSWFSTGNLFDTFPGFHFLTLLFEPLLRLTLHLGGRPILQQGMEGSSTGQLFRVQYRMMDDVGLVSADNLRWLTRRLSGHQRQTAERVLLLAVKSRDSVAHGAVFRYTEDIRSYYGHLIIKAIQLLITAGIEH